MSKDKNIRARDFWVTLSPKLVQRGMLQGQLSSEVKGAQAVDMVIHKIKRLKGIVRVFRVNS